MIALVLMLLASSPDAGCFDNLCGGDTYCSCHRSFKAEWQGQSRCYSIAPDCEIDRVCCEHSKSCVGSPRRGDACTDITIIDRRRREAGKDGGR